MTAPEHLQSAEVLRQAGDEAGAAQAFSQAAEEAHRCFDPATEARAMLGLGAMLLVRDEGERARSAFNDAISRAVEGGVPEVEAEAWFALAAACFDAGLSKDGHDALLEAMALFRKLADEAPEDAGRKGRLARAIRVYGEHLGVLGTESDARQALEIARLMYADLGDDAAARAIADDVRSLKDWAR
jgi:tetratricopeptide (TPR) repeat protein